MTEETQTKEEPLKYKNVAIDRGVDARIVLPKEMSFKEARKWLEFQEKADEEEVAVREDFDAFPFEGAYAFAKAIATTFGFAKQIPTPGFWGDRPPETVSVEVGLNTRVQIPWGRIQIPTIEGYLQTGIELRGNRFHFVLAGLVKAKNKEVVSKIANITRQYIREESIYRGQAITLRFEKDMRKLDPSYAPKFMETASIKPGELIFAEDVHKQVTTSLFTPITSTALCREHKVPLKRGILLSGPFGTGKTLTSSVVAKLCVDNGWTYIYLPNIEDLEQAIHFAKTYEPAVIFAEDIDRVMSVDEDEASGRTEEMNKILNTIDGVDTKHMELLVVLTTNHLEIIEKAMVRPGRLDAVINVLPPDAGAVMRLIHLYARGRLAPNIDLTEVGATLAGQIPAIIRETVERSKLAAISRLQPNEKLLLQAEDLLFAAKEMLSHAALMQPEVEDDRSDIEKAAGVVADAIRGGSAVANGTQVPANGTSHEKRPSATA